MNQRQSIRYTDSTFAVFVFSVLSDVTTDLTHKLNCCDIVASSAIANGDFFSSPFVPFFMMCACACVGISQSVAHPVRFICDSFFSSFACEMHTQHIRMWDCCLLVAVCLVLKPHIYKLLNIGSQHRCDIVCKARLLSDGN